MTDETNLEDFNMDVCALCGGTFLYEVTHAQIKEAEDSRKLYPHMEPIMLCVTCCDKLEARMPHKAYMN